MEDAEDHGVGPLLNDQHWRKLARGCRRLVSWPVRHRDARAPVFMVQLAMDPLVTSQSAPAKSSWPDRMLDNFLKAQPECQLPNDALQARAPFPRKSAIPLKNMASHVRVSQEVGHRGPGTKAWQPQWPIHHPPLIHDGAWTP